MGIEVLLKGATKDLPETLTIDGMLVEFLWGLRYEDEQTEKSRNRLVYERPMWGLSFLRSPKFRVFYSVNVPSFDDLKFNPRRFAKRDFVYFIFGSKALYRAFFHVLNNVVTQRGITEEEYADIVDMVDTWYKNYSDRLKKVSIYEAIFDRGPALEKIKDDFRNHQRIKPYIYDAEKHLTTQVIKSERIL